MAHRWAFRIPDSNLMDGLSWSLHGPDVSIIRDEEDSQPPQFLWASAHLDHLQPGPLLFGRAAALKEVFDGALFLLEPGYMPHPLRDLIDWRQERYVSAFKPAPLVAPFSPEVLQQAPSEREQERVTSHLLEGAIYKARTDADVLSILQILGRHGISFASLYQVRDCLNYAGIDDKQIAFLAGTSKKEVDRFRHTANNYAVLGPSGRHGQTNTQPPQTPMTVDEAAKIILPVAKRFVAHRISGKPLPSQKPPATPSPAATLGPAPQAGSGPAPTIPAAGRAPQGPLAGLLSGLRRLLSSGTTR